MEHHITVGRTARYHTLGRAEDARELWIVLHGYGQLARYFLRHFEGLEAGRLIAAPEALSRFYTDAGHSRVGATWMTREDREAEIADQAAYLNALAQYLMEACMPGARLNVLGFSQGVATACRWARSSDQPIQRLVLWGGMMALELDAPALAEGWKDMEVILVHGEADTLVNEDVLHRNELRLREAGLPFRTERFSGGHSLDRITLRRLMGEGNIPVGG